MKPLFGSSPRPAARPKQTSVSARSTKRVLGTVMGVDHAEAFADPDALVAEFLVPLVVGDPRRDALRLADQGEAPGVRGAQLRLVTELETGADPEGLLVVRPSLGCSSRGGRRRPTGRSR